jgi:uncharacterized protein YndB with AHSA1/START domain
MTRTLSPSSTEMFRFVTSAAPEEVWAALTEDGPSASYLFGVDLHSSWRAGAAVSSSGPEPATLSGTILRADEPFRLSFTLSAGDRQPETYLTWDIRASASGAVVRLYVDQPDGDDGAEELEETWLSVVDRFQSLLHRHRPTTR